MFSTSSGGSWTNAIFDEIALEGLDGTTLPWLWTLLSTRLECGSPLPEKLQQQIWTLLLRSPDKVQFFKLTEERPMQTPYDRSKDLDSDVGMPVVPKTCPFVRLPYCCVQDGPIMGNCADYWTRQPIDLQELKKLTALEATQQWNQTLVVVASQELRLSALKPPNALLPETLSVQQYIFWECVGRSRFNGETMAGTWSLTNYFKDSGFIFYIKKKLNKLNLIAAQSYAERSEGRAICSMLVMLPRFFRIYKSHIQRVIEKLYLEIQLRPSKQLAFTEIADSLEELTPSQVKKIMTAHSFRRIYETIQVLPPDDKSGKDSKKVRKVTVLRLRNPEMKFEELSLLEMNENKEDKAPEFLNDSHAYLDMPIEQECLRAIIRFGARGLSTTELATYVGVNIQTVRTVLKYLLRLKLIKDFTEHVGKTRMSRFVANEQSSSMNNLQLKKTIEEVQCKPEPYWPQKVDFVIKDLHEITANIRHKVFPFKPTRGEEKQTKRHMERQILIVNEIDKKCIVHLMELTRVITQAELNIGAVETICRKSIMRLLQKMKQANICNVYEVTLQYGQRIRLYRLVTHPKIDIEHEYMQREVMRLKSNLHLIVEERPSRSLQQIKNKKRKEVMERKKQQVLEKKSALGSKPSVPKLLLASVLHEFIFFLLVEQPRDQGPLEMNAELLQNWQRTEPALQTRQFLEEWQAEDSPPVPYMEDISWRTFIPPLPKYEDKPAGWLYFMDVVKRMPLSLIMRMFRIERDAMDQLRAQVQHPVRQHYLLHQLKLPNLIPRLRMQQFYSNTLRLMNNMGLIQVSETQLGRDGLQRWVYFNRRSCLLDTTPSSGHNFNRVSPDCKYEELRFEFKTREEVTDYWAKLQHICIYTKLGFLKHRERRKKDTRHVPLSFVHVCANFEEALQLDTGSVPGDRQGAAGLCSKLYAHQFRHWSWVKRTVTSTTGTGSTVGPSAATKRKRRSLMRVKPVAKIQHRKTRAPNASAQLDVRKRKAGPRDDIDRDALRNMRNLRVTWTASEDRLLKMGRAVYMFIDAPLPALALFNVGTICRDLIRHYLGICNKTTQACVRRMQFLIRMKRDLPDVPNWIYTMQTQPEINSVYNERFLIELKKVYPSRSEHNEAILIHFVLIMTKLHHLISSANTVRRQFLLPDTLEDYQRRCRECMPLNGDLDQLLYSNPSTETELQVTIASGVLHSILCCAKDKTLLNLQAFEIYKHFSEDVLNAAFNKARTDCLLVAIRRRNIQTVSRQISGQAHLLSSKYKSRLSCQKLGHVVYDAYYAFEKRFHEQQDTVSVHLASPNFAQLLVMGERLATKRLRLSVQLPNNILTVDTSSMYRSSGSSTDRILDHYSSIFDNAPQTEYAKRLESECCGRQAARVRFHPANLTYRLQCSPYNQLSKLPLRAMHFFCAFDSLGQSVNISCARLEQGECPFGCIMRSGNYLNAVERIVYEHRVILRQLVADSIIQTQIQLHLDDGSPAGSTTLTVSTSNLLSIVKQLETYWRQREQPLECKDLGKVLAERTLHKLTDWPNLCAGLLDFEDGKQEAERTQEYEPSLNKEERARAQDVFVVHLPSIRMEPTERQDLQMEKSKKAQLRTALLEKVIKTSYWRYTENTFDILRPTLQSKNYDTSAIQHMEEILIYIEERPLGVEGIELRRIFPFGKFLFDALHQLESHDLIKRVGVASHMYVHKNHIRNWVVHTFHMKRLEHERIQTLVAASPATPQAVLGEKRRLSALDDVELPCTSKQAKLDMEEPSNASEDTDNDDSQLNSSRRSKRVKLRTESPLAPPPSTTEDDSNRDVIVMRPQPWIRVNASLNRRVLDRWMGAILSECICRNGCTVHNLFLRFPHLLPVDTMFLLELLCDLGCIHLMEMQPQKVDLETTYDNLEEQPATEIYEPKLTYVVTRCDAIARLTTFIGDKKYSSEFI